ncbi:peptide-methionine (S)-S-oxide reductase MsrA [Patescibacteria group bacterium]
MSEIVVFGGGCFWCTEAIFQRLEGVKSTESGYSKTKDKVLVESVKIVFDPGKITYSELLEIFFATHDPTSVDKQNYDVGPQYMSAVFYLDDTQRKNALEKIKILDKSGQHKKPIVTRVEKLGKFNLADSRHQNFYNKNRTFPYCKIIVDPKLQKLEKRFKDKLKH